MTQARRAFDSAAVLGKLHRRLGSWDQAASHLLRSAQSRPKDAKSWESAARALEFAGREGAESAYRQASLLGGLSADSWYRFGRLLEEDKAFSEAVRAYRAAESHGQDAGHMAFRAARCLAELEESTAASVEFRRAAQLGFDPRASFLALEALLDQASPKWVRLNLYREGQPFFAADEPWTSMHARLSGQMRFFPETVTLYESVRQVRSLGIDEVVLFANALEAQGELAKARNALEQAALALPKPTEQALGPGTLFHKERQWSRAREEYALVQALSGLDATLAGNLALTYDHEYRWEEAASAFEEAFRLDPSNGRWAYKCGHAWERAGDYPRAKEWYLHALRLEPTKAHWWYRCGHTLYLNGEYEQAVEALERSLPGEPENLSVTFSSTSSFLGGDTTSSRQWVIDAATEGPWVVRNPEGLIELAKIAIELGLENEANLFCDSAMVHSLELSRDFRIDLSRALSELGRSLDQVEVLLDSRLVRTPDGVNLKTHLPNDSSRASRLYAEFVSERPVDSGIVLLESNHGASAGCHPLAIFSEMLLDPRFAGKRFVWAVNSHATTPPEVRSSPRVSFVRVGSTSYLYHLATAGLLINNVSFPPYFVRRGGQRYLNTWHGTPMKTLGRSMKQGLVEYENLERNFIQASHIIAANELTKWALLNEHHLDGIFPGSVEILGSPRLDALVRDGSRIRASVRARLSISERERVVLVAPTWRGGVSSHDLDQGALYAQLEALSRVQGVRIFYRAHRLTEKLVSGLDLPVEVVPTDIDTNHFLAATDHLVSDYSSVIFDFLVTGRPITLYVPDIEEYRSERGLYLEPEELPVGIAHTVEELVEDVASGGKLVPERHQEALTRYCSAEDGSSAARAVDFLLSDDRQGQQLNGKPTLLFHASMIPNGIASSLLAILAELVKLDCNVLLLVEPAVLREQADRAGVFSRIPEGVRLVARTGGTVMTPEQFYIRGVVESGLSSPGPDMLRRYRESWALEAERITGRIPLAVAIEWDGYATLWGGILSNLGQESTRHLIWQHNEMAEEVAHKFPELEALFQMYPWFDSTVSVSALLAEKNQRMVEAKSVMPKSGVSVVPNALPFDEIRTKSLDPVPEVLRSVFDGAGPVVLSVGRLSMEKNHLSLIEAWPRVLADHPDAKLILLGTGPLEAQLISAVHRLNLGDAITLAGQVENPYPMMAEADLFVLPSLHEGQPVVLFEAMSLGLAIAASECPGNLEAMANGYGAVVPRESAGLGEALSRILTAGEGRGRFDTSAHRSVAINSFLAVVGLASLAEENK